MRVIGIKRLREFWELHPQAGQPLRQWYKVATKARCSNIKEVRTTYPHADAVRLKSGLVVTVFNIQGNHVRLVVAIEYEYHTVYVKKVMTHSQYSIGQWKVSLCQK